MPRKSEPADTGPDPAAPRAYSLACRKCGAAVSYDQPEGDTIACDGCGATNLVPEEVA